MAGFQSNSLSFHGFRMIRMGRDFMSKNTIFTRKAALGDINELCRLYMELPPKVRRMFHPFPFHPMRLKLVFIAMLTGQALLRVYKRVMPRLGFAIFVAGDI